jgi:hypothetical protein
LIFLLDAHTFLCLDGLVQPITPSAARHQPAGKLINDNDLAVLHHIFNVALYNVCALGLVNVVLDFEILDAWRVSRSGSDELRRAPIAFFGQRHGPVFSSTW